MSDNLDPLGQAVEDLIATGFVGGVASNATYDEPHDIRIRPLDVTWRVWVATIPQTRYIDWPKPMQDLIAAAGDAARGRFQEVAEKMKLGRRFMSKDDDELLGWLATFYGEVGVALFFALTSARDGTGDQLRAD